MTWFLLLFILLYGIFIIWIWTGWKKLSFRLSERPEEVFITVIIPVRNEEKNIGLLLHDIQGQDYPAEKFEVIVVDDQSADKTRKIVQDHASASGINIRLLDYVNAEPGEISSKKGAISHGVRMAGGELILLTDGDSRVQKCWLKTIGRHYAANGLKLIAGPVFIQPDGSFFSAVQAVEFASLIGSAASLFFWGYPAMCNGANLAFSKEFFFEVGGYSGNEDFGSGDDEFLMKKISRRCPGKVGFLKSREAIVLTSPAENLPDFIQQRKRWAGKWRRHGNSTNMVLAVFIFLIHCGILAGFVLTLFGYVSVLNFAVFLSVKIFLEFLLLHDIFEFAGKKMKLLPFFICSILYSFYAVIFGVLANVGSYRWKGRKYKY
jgi:poly-beta-1,6-N-acetyl-D-glucosamine synthase